MVLHGIAWYCSMVIICNNGYGSNINQHIFFVSRGFAFVWTVGHRTVESGIGKVGKWLPTVALYHLVNIQKAMEKHHF